MDDEFYKKVAIIILKKRFKIEQPNQNQIKEMIKMLAYVWLKRAILIDEKLTEQEKLCLSLAAQGNTASEIADLLEIAEGTVRTYEREITRKLSCKNMKQAIAVGIRYAEIA